jgi:hypothetical protein
VIAATGLVPVPAADLFALLSDLEEHWRLAGRWVRVLDLDRSPAAGGRPDGGVVQVRGPCGLVHRTLRTRVVQAVADERIEGIAEAGGTRARVSWSLRPADAGTEVRLEAVVERATPLDQVLLACGGARWLERRFARTIARLGDEAVKAGSRTALTTIG